MIEIPNLKVTRKIKSMQSFKESVKTISAGDRAGICVQSIESEAIERTLISSKPLVYKSVLLLEAKKVKYFKDDLKSKSKIHISVLNESVLCKQILIVKPTRFGFEYLEKVDEGQDTFHVIIELEKGTAINILPGAIVIGSKLDSHPSLQKCRIAFHGKWRLNDADSTEDFKIYKLKEKYSFIDRILSENRVIGKGFISSLNENVNNNSKFGKESISKYIGMTVKVYKKPETDDSNESENYKSSESDECNFPVAVGVIDSAFGSTGKFNVILKTTLPAAPSSFYYMKLSFGKVFNGSKEEKFIEIN